MSSAPGSALESLFSIQELLSLILSYLPPSLDEYAIDGPTADDYRSQVTIQRAHSLRDLMRCRLVCRHWHSVIGQSREHREALFLEASHGRGGRKKTVDSQGRSWDVPDSAPWLQLNREVEFMGRGRANQDIESDIAASRIRMSQAIQAPQVLRPRRPQSISRAALSALRERSQSNSRGSLHSSLARSASSSRAPRSDQMYPCRPILNPLLQRYFHNAQFRFNPMHASDSASRYQAHLIIERDDFDQWNDIAHPSSPTFPPFVPTWCNMHLASPPITSIIAVVWERSTYTLVSRPKPTPTSESSSPASRILPSAPPSTPQDREQRTTSFGVGGWDLSEQASEPTRHTGGRRSFYRSDVTMTAVPPSAFYSTKQVSDERGLTMGVVMVAVGEMFAGDGALKAVKVCTQ
ncbi:hypothetical protein BDZ85DRAFT_265603 [Elsinoe ampelina]|uniref:F-box domain-containing protein n=1 Tax=Elsinoe ampelina TaxID=302913 RepID=A0A6A6G7L7_9PEZI|nr:hypothetical protein BDZ85DRAFT_265603 [Elsinoe ampelina]